MKVHRWLGPLVPPLCLAAAAGGVAVVRSGPGWIVAAALVTMLAAGAAWIVASVFFPAIADRTCPGCGATSLERLDRRTTHGVRCTRCGHEDPAASSFYLAEEEGPLERIVLGERAARRAERRARRRPADSEAASAARRDR